MFKALPLVLSLAAGVGLLLTNKKSKAATSGGGGSMPATRTGWDVYSQRIAIVVRNHDKPGAVTLASELRADGFIPAADQLLEQARFWSTSGSGYGPITQDVLSQAGTVLTNTSVGTNPNQLPPVLQLPVPSAPSVSQSAPLDVKRAQALAVNDMLATSTRYREDKPAVVAFQAANGLNPDGMYGAATALRIASYGIIPTRPYYWNKKTAQAKKAAYRKALMQLAAKDPARASEWAAAANVQND